MAFFSSQPDTQLDLQDFALADSFINFDYDPDSGSSSFVEEPELEPKPIAEEQPEPDLEPEPETEQEPEPELEPKPVAEEQPEPESEQELEPEPEQEPEPEPKLEPEPVPKDGNVGCGNIEEGLEKINPVSENGNTNCERDSSTESMKEGQDIKKEDEEIVEENADARNDTNPNFENESYESLEEVRDQKKEDLGINKINTASRNGETSNETNRNSESESLEPIEMEYDKKNDDYEIEEGEIVDSDDGYDCRDDDFDDDVVVGDNNTEDVHNNVILPSVPKVNVTLESHHQMLPVGIVLSIAGAKVIVEGAEKHDPLNEGYILWLTESRTPLGSIDEIFGPVKNPYYVVRYNSENEVPEEVHERTLISFVPEFSNYVLKNRDLYKKGYDAFGPNDEELSNEADFLDDEKEVEYMTMKKMTKRGNNDQRHRGRITSSILPVAPPPPLLDHGHCSPNLSIGRGILGAAPVLPPFPPANAGPNLIVFPQPQSAMLRNGFPANGVSCFLRNTQIPHQFSPLRIPFQQQLNPSLRFPPPTMLPGVQPNVFAQPMYVQGFVDQNQMTSGLSSPFQQIQSPMNFQFISIQGNQHAPQQFYIGNQQGPNQFNPVNQHAPRYFNPGSSAYRGRNTFHRGGRRGWRPSK